MSRDVKRCIQGNHFFRGTAVAGNGRRIGYSTSGWPVARSGQHSITGGEYVAAAWSFRSTTIWTDTYRAVPMIYTTGPAVVAISDSLLLLVDLRRHLGLRNTLNNEAIIARTRTLAITSQQISTDTFINEVTWCPVGRHLKITFREDGPELTVNGVSAFDTFSRTAAGYVETVREACGVIAGQMRAVTSFDDAVPMLGLTGGRDSRLLLAGTIRAGGVHRMLVHAHNATPDNSVDFDRAHHIAKVRGLRINNAKDFDFGPTLKYGANTPTAIWATSFLGIYDRLVPNHVNHGRPKSIPITGVGASLAKGAYGWRSTHNLLEHFGRRPDPSPLAKERHEAFRAQVRKGLDALGVPTDHPRASEWHFLGHRNGLHGGAHLAITMLGLRPLTQSRLSRLVLHSAEDNSPAPGDRIITDMLSVMHIEIASLPYETPDRAISLEQASAWRDSLGGALREAEIPDVAVLGRPTDVVLGPLESGLRIAERMGYDLSHDDRDQMVSVAREWVAGISDPTIRALWEKLADLTSDQFKKYAPAHAGPGPAKLLAAGIFV